MNTKDQTFKFTFKIGVLYRDDTKNKIQVFCFHKDIKYELNENKNFLESILLYEFKGSEEAIGDLKIFLDGLSNPFKPKFDQQKAAKIIQNYAKVLEQPLDDNIFITVSKCRPDSQLKNSINDIKEAIKQSLFVVKDQEIRQALVDGFGSLSCFIFDEKYERLTQLLHRYDELDKDEKIEAEALVTNIEDYIITTEKQLGEEIWEFQKANGFL